MARSLLLAVAFLSRPAVGLRALGGTRHFICSFGPGLNCTAADARQARAGVERAEGTFMELMVIDGDEVSIEGWSGRLGNQLKTLGWALMVAENTGLKAVTWTDDRCVLGSIAELPKRIVLDGSGERGAWTCTMRRLGFRCNDALKPDFRRVLQRYVWPHLTAEARAACALEDGFDGLTVHLRSGDVMWGSPHFQAISAPCAYFSKIIESSGYRDVLMVTEPDRQHPCLEALPRWHPSVNFTVQSKSVMEDFCALVRSRNLARSAPDSTFPAVAELLSRNLRKVYRPQECTCGDPGEASAAVETCYRIPGIAEKRNDTDKMKYLISTPESAVEQLAVCSSDQMLLEGVYKN